VWAKSATVTVQLATHASAIFNGIVGVRAAERRTASGIHASCPHALAADAGADCRIFQNKTARRSSNRSSATWITAVRTPDKTNSGVLRQYNETTSHFLLAL